MRLTRWAIFNLCAITDFFLMSYASYPEVVNNLNIGILLLPKYEFIRCVSRGARDMIVHPHQDAVQCRGPVWATCLIHPLPQLHTKLLVCTFDHTLGLWVAGAPMQENNASPFLHIFLHYFVNKFASVVWLQKGWYAPITKELMQKACNTNSLLSFEWLCPAELRKMVTSMYHVTETVITYLHVQQIDLMQVSSV